MPRVDAIATRLLSQIPKSAVADGQKRLAAAQTEAMTGRHADVGLSLGARTGSAIGLRLELDAITGGIGQAKQAGLRAKVTQDAMNTFTQVAQGFMSMLTGARTAENGKDLAAISAASALEALETAFATTHDGQYIFGGLNSGAAPLTRYDDGPRQSVAGAFEAAFGFPPSDPAAGALTGSDIAGFLDNGFAALFEDPSWGAVWSGASGQRPLFRLASGEALDLSANASQPFARSLAQAFAMVEMLGQSEISRDSFQTVADRAMALVAEAHLEIGYEQARIGFAEARLKNAVEAMELSETRFASALQALEGVDPYEAATRINLLMTQLETSYALTGRINRLSLLSYI